MSTSSPTFERPRPAAPAAPSAEPPLRSEPETAGDVRREGPATHRRVRGIHVLSLEGTAYEMGYQHGALLRDEIPKGPIPYYRAFVEKLMGPSLGPLSPLVWPLLQRFVGRRVAQGIPSFAMDTIRGIADGAQLPFEQFLDGCTMPDALVWVAARSMQLKRPGPAVAHRMALGLGCTSAIAWGRGTVDGRLLHARNFDYHGVGCWPDSAALLFHKPDQGHRYVSVGAAGVGLGGVTAMNDAGLSLTVHQHMFTDRARLGGTPIGILGDLVMREASCLDDAERILREHTPIGCWTYLVTDAHKREVLCFEENPDRKAVIRRGGDDDPTFGYANIYLDRELGETEINLYGSYWRHNLGRHQRANEVLRERSGSLDPRAMASILADTGDPRCRIRTSIAMVMTVASVVFRPEDGTLWLGTGQAPTSHGAFVPFSLARGGHAPGEGELVVGPEGDAPGARAFEAFRKAYVAYLDERDVSLAHRLLDEARTAAPREPMYHWLAGMMALLSNQAEPAIAAFDRALALGHPDPERIATCHLWRARALDVAGRRDDVVAAYGQSLARPSDPPVRAAALAGLERAFTARRVARTQVDMGLCDVIAP
jgi:hypothetical protein